MDAGTKPSIKMVEKLTEVNGIGKVYRDLVASTATLIALPYLIGKVLPEDLEAVIRRHMDDGEVNAVLHAVYEQIFSADEVLDIIAFLKTPSGQKLLEKDSVARDLLSKTTPDFAIRIASNAIMSIQKPN